MIPVWMHCSSYCWGVNNYKHMPDFQQLRLKRNALTLCKCGPCVIVKRCRLLTSALHTLLANTFDEFNTCPTSAIRLTHVAVAWIRLGWLNVVFVEIWPLCSSWAQADRDITPPWPFTPDFDGRGEQISDQSETCLQSPLQSYVEVKGDD